MTSQKFDVDVNKVILALTLIITKILNFKMRFAYPFEQFYQQNQAKTLIIPSRHIQSPLCPQFSHQKDTPEAPTTLNTC